MEVELFYTQGDEYSVDNLTRKQHQADEMFTRLVSEMNNSLSVINKSEYAKKLEVPSWA